MSKNFWLAVIIAFVLLSGMEVLLHGVILDGFYKDNPQGLLPAHMTQARFHWMFVGYLILAFLWTYFFSRFATKKDIYKGIHHGVSYMIFLHVPLSFVCYTQFRISGYIYLWWTIGGIVEGIIIGGIMGAVMREKEV